MRALLLSPLLVLLAACNTPYQPNAVDAKSGLHPTTVTVDAGGVIPTRSSVHFSDYGAVLLYASSNAYPSRLEFLARKELADMGFTRVLNATEFRRWAEDMKVGLPVGNFSLADVQRFSQTVKPILVVDVRYQWVGGVQHFGGARVVDGRNGEALLTIDHPKKVWVDTNDEVIYPVFNELRKWRKRVDAQAT